MLALPAKMVQNYFQICQMDKYELGKDFWFLSLMDEIKL